MRIDFLFKIFETSYLKFNSRNEQPVSQSQAIGSETISVPMTEDKTINQGPRANLFLLMNDFHGQPTKENRERVLSFLRNNLKIFTPVLEKDFESKIYELRDLFQQNNEQAFIYILDLITILPGENLEMLKRFLSHTMDDNMENFITQYHKNKDVNCMLASLISDPVPEEDKINIFYERDEALTQYLSKDTLPLLMKEFATRCQLVVKLQIDKLTPKPAPATTPVAEPTPVLTPTTQEPTP